MDVSKLLSDQAILAEMGARIARHRLDQQLTQTAVADEAGISKRTLERIEAGESAQFLSVIRVLRALGLLANLNLLLPELGPSPLDALKLKGKERQRASTRKSTAAKKPWNWGDEV